MGDIPRNVDIDRITKSIVYSQYLKLSFPKFYESINGFEIPDNTNPHINEHYHSNSNNIINNNNNEEVKQNHHAGRRTEKRREHSKYMIFTITEIKKNIIGCMKIYMMKSSVQNQICTNENTSIKTTTKT